MNKANSNNSNTSWRFMNGCSCHFFEDWIEFTSLLWNVDKKWLTQVIHFTVIVPGTLSLIFNEAFYATSAWYKRSYYWRYFNHSRYCQRIQRSFTKTYQKSAFAAGCDHCKFILRKLNPNTHFIWTGRKKTIRGHHQLQCIRFIRIKRRNLAGHSK